MTAPATTATYRVTGMTCGHCVTAVRAELSELHGVIDVTVDLAAGASSMVRVVSAQPLRDEQVERALDEAGDYRLEPGVRS